MAQARRKQATSDSPIVPRSLGGKWIAWDRNRKRIIASGETLREARDAASAAGEADPGYEWVPPAAARIIGWQP